MMQRSEFLRLLSGSADIFASLGNILTSITLAAAAKDPAPIWGVTCAVCGLHAAMHVLSRSFTFRELADVLFVATSFRPALGFADLASDGAAPAVATIRDGAKAPGHAAIFPLGARLP